MRSASLYFYSTTVFPSVFDDGLLLIQVIRTRLRQPLVNGEVKYKGLVQTLRLVIAEEGAKSLYGGLSAHLMRVIPNAAVMFFVYESIMRL